MILFSGTFHPLSLRYSQAHIPSFPVLSVTTPSIQLTHTGGLHTAWRRTAGSFPVDFNTCPHHPRLFFCFCLLISFIRHKWCCVPIYGHFPPPPFPLNYHPDSGLHCCSSGSFSNSSSTEAAIAPCAD